MTVRLSLSEIQIAYAVAGQRAVYNMKVGAQHRHGASQGLDSDVLDIIGCRGEMAVAKALNLFWSGAVGNYSAADVGGFVEVRSAMQPGHSLILHPDDRDEAPFVLCYVTRKPEIELLGWLWGRDGKAQRYWSDPSGKNRPAFFVPQRELRPMPELIEILRPKVNP